ncbi:hypothetical protein HD554DRAFT_2207385 [Boletus coccyginus]|nr:hypothetical protein HD554DRAFT_2207385 [Boletus coccyginus]
MQRAFSALPGRPIAMVIFKTWGYITMTRALTFSSDFKLAQVVATVITGTVQLGVQAWMFTNIADICSQAQKNGFTCPSTEVSGTASIVWGVIGPIRVFSPGQIYGGVIGRLIRTRWPNNIVRYVNFPVIFNDVLSSALDAGVAFAVIIIFFALQYPKNGTIGLNTVQAWWGNTVFLNTADGQGLPYKAVPASGTFG